MKSSESKSASTGTSSKRSKPSSPSLNAAPETKILWSEWWPFERATGEALRQLNRPVQRTLDDVEEAPI